MRGNMAYEHEEVKMSQQIFYYLLEHKELKEDDEAVMYKAYTQSENVQNLVKSQAEVSASIIERYGNVIYLIPKEENNFLGFSKAQLKAQLCKSGATDKDYYLSQFVVLTLLTEFFDGQGSSSKSRDFIKVGELQNSVSKYLKEGANAEEKDTEENVSKINFTEMLQAFEALRSEEKGSRAKTTKEGFLYTILMFLQKQGLIDYIEQDEMIKTTTKLDNFMDWNMLNRNNYEKLLAEIKGEKKQDE